MEKKQQQQQQQRPTGCYKCGRPGHWARDCTLAPAFPNSNSNPATPAAAAAAAAAGSASYAKPNNSKSSGAAVKKVKTPRKPNESMLLSEAGLGYILENFPKMMRIKGPGHEFEDLQSFLYFFVHWHSQFFPSMPYHDFVNHLEKLGSTRRVRTCLRDLRERVDRGEKPTINPEAPESTPDDEELAYVEEVNGAGNEDEPADFEIQANLFDRLYREATEKDPEQGMQTPFVSDSQPQQEGQERRQDAVTGNKESSETNAPSVTQIQITEEQKARMEANRRKALERKAARSASTSNVEVLSQL